VRKLAGLEEDHTPVIAAFFKGRLVHGTDIIVHILQVLVHFRGCLPQFKLKFDRCTLLHVET
jgi:hypothetical protein